MTKEVRLIKAKEWIANFEGENIVKAYSKCTGLNLKNSMTELRRLGANISPEEKAEVKQWVESRIRKREKRKEKEENERLMMEYEDSNETFAFIAGYTSGGVAYGITYEEMEEME